MKTVTSIFSPRKVSLEDVVSPKPSKAAAKTLDRALKKAYSDQELVKERARAIRLGV